MSHEGFYVGGDGPEEWIVSDVTAAEYGIEDDS